LSKNHKISKYPLIIILFALAALSVVNSQTGNDEIVDYYWGRTSTYMNSHNPLEAGLQYSFTARSYYKKINKKGEVEFTDSVRTEYYYSWGKLDSSKTLEGEGEGDRFQNLDFSFPNIFESEYISYFFPNDTGGVDLAIGFDTDSAQDTRPVGLVLIDRNRYVLRWMYLFYPQKRNFDRFSRSFRFREHEGYVFPDSIWEIGKKQGIFTTENYRMETGVSDIKIYR